MENIKDGFTGIIHEPDNEQEVIALFLVLMKNIKPTWCIKRLQTHFPDAIFYDTFKKKDIRVEFEFRASGFNHDENGCDIIICWENDLPKLKSDRMNLEILPLRNYVNTGDLYLGIVRPNLLDRLLEEGIEKVDRTYIATNRVVNIEISRLKEKFYPLFLDRNTTAHYVLRWNGKGFFGIYPNGRLIAENIKEYIRKFGDRIGPAGQEFRHIVKDVVKGLNVGPKLSDDELNKRVMTLVNAIEDFCKQLEVLGN